MTMKDASEGSEKKKEEKKQGLACEKQRKLTYLNRIQGLKKKLQELTTHSDISGFMIVIPETQPGCSSVEPITWPENQPELLGLIQRYKSTDHKKRRENHSSNMPQGGDGLDGLSLEQLQDLKVNIDSKLSLLDSLVPNFQ